ncbi:senescence-associated protein-domain-containing protein [Podospora fimiseda]|uniref:Senescence-associated protein-domain-containing protein n=1 Tax=Podospora fimiseda TaxID=252190 RepID=A0AAN7BND0_9PEZI|nr:senescence-associated protein-domain-containing protein [Podospora fimiseda]
MASGHNDPKLLYAINGVKAYHIANGKQESLTPAGPQTLSLLMVPTSSAFADPAIDAETAANAEQDFYLHLHLPPELDLPLPATTQIYHQPPTSYLIPRWDLGPDSGAFTKIEFPSVESRKGIQEDVDTFETILAQCTAFLERAPPPKFSGQEEKSWWDDKDLKGKNGASSSAKSTTSGETLPAYNPADFQPGEAYARGSHSKHAPGQIVLVDEEDGSVIGELTDGYKIVEDGSLKPGSKDPVEITLPANGGQNIAVAPISRELYEAELHPAYKNSFLVSNASAASRLIITGSDMLAKLLQGQADSYTKKATPAAKPMTFQPTTKEHIRRINTFTGGAASLSAKTVGQIGKVAQNFGAHLGGHSNKERGKKGFDKDGKPVDTYKPGLLNKTMMAFSTVMDGVDQASRHLLASTSDAATTVVQHKWGDEAGDISRSIGGGVRNVGLVYIDVTGVSRRALIKSVAKGMVVGKTVNGESVIVGGGDGGAIVKGSGSGGNGGSQSDAQSLSGMTVVEGKQPPSSITSKQPQQISLKSTTTITTDNIKTNCNKVNNKMLHDLLLSLTLSSSTSPLLIAASQSPSPTQTAILTPSTNQKILSPPELSLLKSLATISILHSNISAATNKITTTTGHKSIICRSIASAIDSIYLQDEFQSDLVELEERILKKDAELVGGYDIVPLTKIVATIEGNWKRRLEWLWEVVRYIGREEVNGVKVLDLLAKELRTGYKDVEEVARVLLGVGERSWLKMLAGWVLYGRLVVEGSDDFFVKEVQEGGREEWEVERGLVPGFVDGEIAESVLFVGRSLNQIKKRKEKGEAAGGVHLSGQLKRLGELKSPLDRAGLGRVVKEIREVLSRTVLLKLLPVEKVVGVLELLRNYFLLRKGEFAMALTQQADERVRSRWRRGGAAGNESSSGGGGNVVVTVKEGEVAAVLARTWAAIGSMKGEYADEDEDEEDEGVELARDLLRLTVVKSRPGSNTAAAAAAEGGVLASIAQTPFRNLLFSVPVVLTMQIPSPLDLFLSQADLQTYTAINSYLLSLRRAHLRLTDLWKITSLRRHHPAPPNPKRGATRGGREMVRLLRQRHTTRSNILRNAWATASAAIFFLGETEGYLQTEVVAGLSDGFHSWLTTGQDQEHSTTTTLSPNKNQESSPAAAVDEEDDDIWLEPRASSPEPSKTQPHDPQTLATAHRLYLRTLVARLLLNQPTFTDPLYELLAQIDHLVSLVYRLDLVWTAADLEADVGVVDAFVDLAREERDVTLELRGVEDNVKVGIQGVVEELRRLEGKGAADEDELVRGAGEEAEVRWERGEYVPRRVGGVDRLLMKLDFGGWFENGEDDGISGL